MERRPQHGVVEGPVADRPGDHPEVAPAQDLDGLGGAVDQRPREAAMSLRRSGCVLGRIAHRGRSGGSRTTAAITSDRHAAAGSAVSHREQIDPDEAERHERPMTATATKLTELLIRKKATERRAIRSAVHAAPVQDPGAEGEPAGAAGGHEGAHRQLRAADLPAAPPAQAAAEDRREHDDVGGEGESLEQRRDRQPSGAAPASARAPRPDPARGARSPPGPRARRAPGAPRDRGAAAHGSGTRAATLLARAARQ